MPFSKYIKIGNEKLTWGYSRSLSELVSSLRPKNYEKYSKLSINHGR